MKQDIVNTAYYIISKYNQEKREITNLRLECLLYISTKCIKDLEYDDEFYQDISNPQFDIKSEKVYTIFKNYIPLPIILFEEEMIFITNQEFKKQIDRFIEATKDFTTIDIVALARSLWEAEM